MKNDIYLLETLVPIIGNLTLDQIHDQTLAAYVKQRKDRELPHKTINLGLGIVRRILHLAAREWRDEKGRTWLETPPLISMMPPIGFQREPRPILGRAAAYVAALSGPSRKMVLFDLNTDARIAAWR